MNAPVPCHLIAGPLGVGKTTAIIDLVRRRRGREFTAVLVNDFGPIGLDSAVIDADAGDGSARDALSVVNIPGGCVCCSAAEGLVAGFMRIAKLPHVDRILVEPSGVAVPGEVADLIAQIRLPFTLELRPTVVMVDPGDVASMDDPATPRIPYFDQLIDAADVLVANRCDLAGEATMAKFHAFAATLYPPRLRIVTTSMGRLPDDLLDLPAAPRAERRFFVAEKTGHEVMQSSGGTRWPGDVAFRLDALLPRVRSLATHGLGGVKVERLKGVFLTDRGWRLVEIARGEVHHRPTGYRGDNRVDWITGAGEIEEGPMRARLIEAVSQPVF